MLSRLPLDAIWLVYPDLFEFLKWEYHFYLRPFCTDLSGT
jgi:hypothetical protein